VSGNIGEGKTTLIKELVERVQGAHRLVECVEQWQPLLKDFYDAPKGNAYPLQTEIFRTAMQQHEQVPSDARIVISERTFIDHKLFELLQFRAGNITANQHNAYLSWADLWTRYVPYPLTGVIYLRTGTDECLERIRRRHRDGENAITLDYLDSLQKVHDEMFGTRDNQMQVRTGVTEHCVYTVPVLVVNNSAELNTSERNRVLQRIVDFIEANSCVFSGSSSSTDDEVRSVATPPALCVDSDDQSSQ
jgi:deoxyadenosine/deoxycytidine kinase